MAIPRSSPSDALGASTIARLNLKLIPFLMLLYLVAYIDRANISVAALQMNADLGLTTRMYGIAAGLFYVTYVAAVYCGVGLPPLMGYIKDTMGTYDYALLLVAAALLAGGALGLYLGPATARSHQPA